MLKKSVLVTLVLILSFITSSAAAETCPISVEHTNSTTTVITAPGGAKFKIDDKFIKTLLPEAFDQEKWTFANLTKGAGKITGIIENGSDEKTVSVFIVLKRGNSVDWFLTVNKDLQFAEGKWIVASSIGNRINCSESSSLEEATIDESMLKPYGLKKAELKIQGSGYVYSRMGI